MQFVLPRAQFALVISGISVWWFARWMTSHERRSEQRCGLEFLLLNKCNQFQFLKSWQNLKCLKNFIDIFRLFYPPKGLSHQLTHCFANLTRPRGSHSAGCCPLNFASSGSPYPLVAPSLTWSKGWANMSSLGEFPAGLPVAAPESRRSRGSCLIAGRGPSLSLSGCSEQSTLPWKSPGPQSWSAWGIYRIPSASLK